MGMGVSTRILFTDEAAGSLSPSSHYYNVMYNVPSAGQADRSIQLPSCLTYPPVHTQPGTHTSAQTAGAPSHVSMHAAPHELKTSLAGHVGIVGAAGAVVSTETSEEGKYCTTTRSP